MINPPASNEQPRDEQPRDEKRPSDFRSEDDEATGVVDDEWTGELSGIIDLQSEGLAGQDQTPVNSPPVTDGVADRAADRVAVQLERRQELERLLRSNPTNRDAFLELAAIYRKSNRPVEARRVLKQALEVFADDHELLWQYEESVLARSLQQYREVADLAGRLRTPEADRELSRATQDWALRRIEVCRARLTRDPSLTHLIVSLGEAHYDAEDYDDAIQTLSRVLDRDEFSPAAYLLVGRCQLAKGDDLQAMASLRACALRRSVVAPPRIKLIALRMLCDTAQRLGLDVTRNRYQAGLATIESEIASTH